MADLPKGDLMERIDRLERANRVWRIVSFLSIAGILVVAGFAFSQGNPQKGQPVQPIDVANIPIDPAPAPVTYTNFVRVSVTPEELILDLALNTQMAHDQPIRPSNRVVMNFYSAKRLSNALQQVVQQYEATYGPLELDFQKRIVPNAKAPAGK